jgi:shikimate 5-dehydrogenase/shikimate kinase
MEVRNSPGHPISRTGPSRPLAVSNSSGTNTPEPRPFLTSSIKTSRTFAPNASIVLIGIRACGKTSLGYIAARALGRRLVDGDEEFRRKMGLTRAQFLKSNGHNAEEYRTLEMQVMESMLTNYERDAVIVCGVGSIEAHGQALLRKYALSHPVIHVVRETEHVKQWLRIPEGGNILERLEQMDRLHRTCSNFEFFNLFDGGSEPGITDGRISRDELSGPGQSSPRQIGALQRTQQDFIRFINLVMGFPDSTLQALGSKITAATASPADRVYTYALSLEFSQLEKGSLDVTELECGADAIELEVHASDLPGQSLFTDATWTTKLSKQFAILRRKIGAPIIYHVNRSSFLQIAKDRQLSQDDVYQELLHLGLRMGAEFLTIDIDVDELSMQQILQAKGSIAIVGDYLDTNPSEQGWDDPKILERYQKAAKMGCDIIRMSQFASSDEDNFAIRRFIQRSTSQDGIRLPLIAYNVGRSGRASMCFNTILTTVTHPKVRALSGRKGHQALLTMQEASRITYDLGLLDPLHFCIFGGSVLYSLSPAMHNAAYQSVGLPHEYRIRQSSTIEELDGLLNDPSFGGAAVTLPFKIEVLKRVDSMSAEAQAIGAANTIIPIRSSMNDTSQIQKSRAGRIVGWHGDNTDWIGITTCIRRNLSPANSIRPWTSGLVVGAGGMARAAIYALIRFDVPNIFICNRTVSNAEKLALHFTKLAATHRSPHSRNIKRRVMVLNSMNEEWPAEYEQPTIVVSCVPAHSIGGAPEANMTLPIEWLQSVNGGVIIEVCFSESSAFCLEYPANV